MHTDEQIDAAAVAATAAYHDDELAWTMLTPDVRDRWRRAVRAALASLEPAPDPELVTWTPEHGPLAAALADLPDWHPITIRGSWGELNCRMTAQGQMVSADLGRKAFLWGLETLTENVSVTSASWPRPQPAWATPRPPLVVSAAARVFALRADGTYSRGIGGEGFTPAQLDHLFVGDVSVLIDAGGNHTEGQQ